MALNRRARRGATRVDHGPAREAVREFTEALADWCVARATADVRAAGERDGTEVPDPSSSRTSEAPASEQ